jgi:hypothetical protein
MLDVGQGLRKFDQKREREHKNSSLVLTPFLNDDDDDDTINCRRLLGTTPLKGEDMSYSREETCFGGRGIKRQNSTQ